LRLQFCECAKKTNARANTIARRRNSLKNRQCQYVCLFPFNRCRFIHLVQWAVMFFVSMFRHSKTLSGILLALCLFAPRTAQAADGRKPQFHLGTASIHVGLSSAVGNLDSDDKLDFAVADRTGKSPDGYNYRLQLAHSHEGSQVFHFHSKDSALNLSIIDLDDDADLDVVLTHTLSGEIAGVWLNTGGRFHEGNTAEFSGRHVRLGDGVALTSETIPTGMASLPLRKTLTALTGSVRLELPDGPAFGSLRDFADLGTKRVSDRSVTSRAPPTTRLS